MSAQRHVGEFPKTRGTLLRVPLLRETTICMPCVYIYIYIYRLARSWGLLLGTICRLPVTGHDF